MTDESETYRLFARAILGRKQIICRYLGHRRELCPVILGHSRQGDEKALTFQFAGGSTSRLPSGGEWRCLFLSKVSEAELRDGPWHSGERHTRPHSCIDIVDLDINSKSPYSPLRPLSGRNAKGIRQPAKQKRTPKPKQKRRVKCKQRPRGRPRPR